MKISIETLMSVIGVTKVKEVKEYEVLACENSKF